MNFWELESCLTKNQCRIILVYSGLFWFVPDSDIIRILVKHLKLKAADRATYDELKTAHDSAHKRKNAAIQYSQKTAVEKTRQGNAKSVKCCLFSLVGHQALVKS